MNKITERELTLAKINLSFINDPNNVYEVDFQELRRLKKEGRKTWRLWSVQRTISQGLVCAVLDNWEDIDFKIKRDGDIEYWLREFIAAGIIDEWRLKDSRYDWFLEH